MYKFEEILLSTILSLATYPLWAQTFTESSHLLDVPSSGTPGASAIDFNNDGLTDIYHPGRFYLNRGESGFTDIRLRTEVIEGGGVFGAAFADYDNDGYLDVLFEDLGAPSRLYRNDGNRTFTQTNDTAQLAVNPIAQTAAWADFNLDGYIDLFVNQDDGQNQLFKNLGDGRFADISLSAGIQAPGNAYGMAWGDFNRDGYPDIFVAPCSNDPVLSIKHLFLNNGDETFTDINVASGVNDSLASWGTVVLDFNNDGHMDIFVANLDHFPRRGFNKLYRNNGDSTFTDVSIAAGVAGEDDENSYGVSVADFDNDGWLDLYVASVTPGHRLYRNNSDGTFTDISQSVGVNGNFSLGVAVGDFNDDGWVDIFAPSNFANLWMNDGGSNHWLTVKTRGATSNYHGIGTRVELYSGGQFQVREINAGDGFCAQNLDLSAHFGLGSATRADSLILIWPGGERQKLTDLTVDRKITVVQGLGIDQPPTTFALSSPADGQTLGSPTAAVQFDWQAAFDQEAGNLSYRLLLSGPETDTVLTVGNATFFAVATDLFSQNQICSWTVDVSDGSSVIASTDVFRFGDEACQADQVFAVLNEIQTPLGGISASGSSWGDFNEDGFVDAFMLDRRGNNRLLANSQGSGFVNAGITAESGASRGSTWGDYDGDDDLDLFVTNFDASNTLFVNNNGTLSRDATQIFSDDTGASLGCSWVDIDNDLRLDLFVVNNNEPNFLYMNTGNNSFIKITEGAIISVATRSLGAAFADYDNDGDSDLYLTDLDDSGLYENKGDGTFARVTDGPIGSETQGGWGATWGDFDNDGDLDLFVARYGEQDLLFRNDGARNFVRISEGPIVADMDLSRTANWLDFENDGDLDLFVGNQGFSSLYINQGDGSFSRNTSDISLLNGAETSSAADYDYDGDVDLLIGNRSNGILYTNLGSDNNWANIHCTGTVSNYSAIGAKIRLKATIFGQPVWQMRHISGQTSYLSQDSPDAAFGLGDAMSIDSLVIEWPAGSVEVATNLSVNQFYDAVEGSGVVSSVDEKPKNPLTFSLGQNYPNPFNPETTISYELPQAAEVKIEIFNVLGQKVRTLADVRQEAGLHRVAWDGKNDAGGLLPTGPYFYRIATDKFTRTKRMLFLK